MFKILALACVVAFTSAIVITSAQAQINWNFTDGNATPDGGIPPNISVSNLSLTNGGAFLINSTSASTGYTGASGGNNASATAATGSLNISTSTYFSFTLTPDMGFQVNATDFTFGSRSTATGPTVISLRSSIDNYTTDLATNAAVNDSVWRLISLSFTAAGAPNQAVTFRLYGSGGSGTAGSGNWRIDDLNFTASAAVVPEPSIYAMVGVGLAFLFGAQRLRRYRS